MSTFQDRIARLGLTEPYRPRVAPAYAPGDDALLPLLAASVPDEVETPEGGASASQIAYTTQPFSMVELLGEIGVHVGVYDVTHGGQAWRRYEFTGGKAGPYPTFEVPDDHEGREHAQRKLRTVMMQEQAAYVAESRAVTWGQRAPHMQR